MRINIFDWNEKLIDKDRDADIIFIKEIGSLYRCNKSNDVDLSVNTYADEKEVKSYLNSKAKVLVWSKDYDMTSNFK